MTEKIRVLVVPVEGAPYEESIENTIEAMQSIVDGYVEQIAMPGGLVVLCNEDAIPLQLPICARLVVPEPTVRAVTIRGRFLIARLVMPPYGAVWASLTDEDLRTLVVVLNRGSVKLASEHVADRREVN